jgi:hypothetical protein
MAGRLDRVSGIWDPVKKRSDKVSGVWQPVKKRYDKVNGIWVPSYQGYDAQAHNIFAPNIINADGSIYYPHTRVSPSEYDLFYLKLNSPVSYSVGSVLLTISNLTTFFSWNGAERQYVFELQDYKNPSSPIVLDFEYSDMITPGTSKTKSYSFGPFDVSGVSDTFLLRVGPNLVSDNYTLGLSAAAGCITIGGIQLKNLELI